MNYFLPQDQAKIWTYQICHDVPHAYYYQSVDEVQKSEGEFTTYMKQGVTKFVSVIRALLEHLFELSQSANLSTNKHYRITWEDVVRGDVKVPSRKRLHNNHLIK